MGMGFSAILRCDAASDAISNALDGLESLARPEPLQQVLHRWQECGFFDLSDWGGPSWVRSENHQSALSGRPLLPNVDAELRLPEGFFVTVAKDSIIVCHLVAWDLFLTEVKWRSVMFEAIRWMRMQFSAEDCVMAHDYHPVPWHIRKGMTFQAALERAEQEGCGEVEAFGDLYLVLESDSNVAMKPAKGGLSQCVSWPKDKPLPLGWSRPTVWDSKGYWRFDS